MERKQLEMLVREQLDDYDGDELSKQIAIALMWKELRGDLKMKPGSPFCALPTMREMYESGAIQLSNDTVTRGDA